MGILSDILEDNRERVWQLLGNAPFSPVDEAPASPHVRFVGCPLCPTIVPGEDELQRHILAFHRRLQVYVRLNGEVIQDLHYTATAIDEFVVVLLGDSPAELTLAVDGKVVGSWRASPGRVADIRRRLPRGFVGAASLTIAVTQSTSRIYRIFSGTQPSVDVAALDSAVMELQAEVLSRTEPEWGEFQKRHAVLMQKPIEARYLEGFFSYLLGVRYEQNDHRGAGSLFEDAFGRLRPFQSTLAHTARCILALKLNAFSILDESSSESQFYNARLFFNSAPEKKKRARRFIGDRQAATHGVWADPFTELVLNAIDAYYEHDWCVMERHLKGMGEHALVKDRNNSDKLLFLRARLSRTKGDIKSAYMSYTELSDHPLFGSEAQHYCAQH